MFLTKRLNGYYYLYYNDEATGKRQKVSTKTKLKAEAMKFLKDFKIDSKPMKPEIIYLETLQFEVLKYTHSNLSPATHRLYITALKNLLSFLGNKPVKQVTTKELDNYKNKRADEIKKATVNIELTCIKAVFNLALKWDFITDNPAKEVRKFKIEQKEILNFTDTELQVIFAKMPKGLIKNVVTVAISTGCRLNEILNLQYRDIDLSQGIITIRNKNDFKTKSGRIRRIPIANSLETLLRSLLGHDSNVYELNNTERYLFANENGFRYNKDYISRRFKRYLRACNMPEKFHFHCLRHTYITNLVKAGANMNYIKQIAGHADLKTTENYIHIGVEDLRNAVNKVNINF